MAATLQNIYFGGRMRQLASRHQFSPGSPASFRQVGASRCRELSNV